ncbi:hypothetical protein [Nostoc sp.]
MFRLRRACFYVRSSRLYLRHAELRLLLKETGLVPSAGTHGGRIVATTG